MAVTPRTEDAGAVGDGGRKRPAAKLALDPAADGRGGHQVLQQRQEDLGASLTVDPERIAVADAIAAVAARVPLADLTVREPEMESILRQIYETPGAMA